VITPLKLCELLILREEMPRSLHFCLKQVAGTLGRVQNAHSADTERLAADMLTALWETSISEIFARGLHEYLTDFLESMQTLSIGIQRSFFASSLVDERPV